MSSMSDEEKEKVKEQTKIQLETMQEFGKQQMMKQLKYMIPLIIIVFLGTFIFIYLIAFTDLLIPKS